MDNDEVRRRISARHTTRWNSLDILDGWLPIVDELDRALAALDPDYSVGQVKEKFGGLRYYISRFTPEMGDRWDVRQTAAELIRAAEERSFGVCEKCGTTEGVTTEGVRPQDKWSWIKTLCKTCREDWPR